MTEARSTLSHQQRSTSTLHAPNSAQKQEGWEEGERASTTSSPGVLSAFTNETQHNNTAQDYYGATMRIVRFGGQAASVEIPQQ